jgi:predicted membrane-bound dolichyl-phosphate-mannose-protein mannosyltransferase
MLQLAMKKALPYLLIAALFFIFLFWKHPDVFSYKFNQRIVRDYLRSQDIEDPKGLIKDRIIMSDGDTYAATGYLYAKGEDPTIHNFQHPPLVKYLFGFSILLTGNPFYVQVFFGLVLLWLTYFLGTKLGLGNLGYLGVLGLLIDPLFGSQMTETLLDPGQAVFALSYIILILFYPESYILSGVVLGLFVASKFWSTAVIFVGLVYLFKILLLKQKPNYKKVAVSFLIAFGVFALTYLVAFIKQGGRFDIFFFLAKELKYILSHDSAGAFGGTILLFFKGYILWPVSLLTSVYLLFKTKVKDIRFFFLVLPAVYLLSVGSALPFTRYFLMILPFLYINLVAVFQGLASLKK